LLGVQDAYGILYNHFQQVVHLYGGVHRAYALLQQIKAQHLPGKPLSSLFCECM
jgi:hypothetical protein